MTHVIHRVRRKAVLAGLVLAVSAGLLASAPLTSGARAATPTFHHCAVMGTVSTAAGTFQAVHCADIFTDASLGVWVRNQVYCQPFNNSRVQVSCNGIIEHLAYGGPGFTRRLGTGSCGRLVNRKACPATRVIHEARIGVERPGSARRCTRWGESVGDVVEMPHSTRTFSVTVIATSHFTYPC
ncbi:MAG: hypothetical protein J2P32_02710 [Actinobacteria bacterium]|nr:hypothetical protein [Actinomycetota bacterium]